MFSFTVMPLPSIYTLSLHDALPISCSKPDSVHLSRLVLYRFVAETDEVDPFTRKCRQLCQLPRRPSPPFRRDGRNRTIDRRAPGRTRDRRAGGFGAPT